ncbi:hypothetical protein K7432_008167 [Basidiobolus ranarum]
MSKKALYDRMKVLVPFMNTLKKHEINDQKNLTISYAYLSVTDKKCIDLQTGRSVTADLLNHGVDPFLSPIQSFEEIEEKLSQGCTLPFVLAIRFETSGTDPTSGTLYLIDMGVPRYIPMDSIMTKETPVTSTISGVSKSFYIIRKIATQLTSGSFVGPLPHDDTYLTLLISEFLSGNCKSLFVFNVESTERELNRETAELLEFGEILRKMKTREKMNSIDRRVIQHERRCKQYKTELKKIQADYETQFGILRQQEALLQEFQDTNKSLQNKIHDLTKNCVNLKEQCNELQASEIISTMDARLSSSTMTTEIVTLKEDIRRVRVNLSLVTDQRDMLAMKCTNVELKLAVLQNSFDEQATDYERCQESVITSKLELKSVEEILCTLRTTYSELKEAHNQILEKLTLETQNARQLQTENHELKEKLQDESKKFEAQTHKIKTLEKENISLETQLEKRTVKIEKERKKWLLERTSGSQTSDELIYKVSDLEQTIRKLRAEAKNGQNSFEKQKIQMTDRIEEVNRELSAAKAKSEFIVAQHQLELKSWTSEKKDLIHQVKELELKFNNAESMVNTKQVLRDSTQQGNSKMEEKFKKMQDKFMNAVNLAADTQFQLEERLSNWNDERNQLKSQILSLEKKINQNKHKPGESSTPTNRKRINDRDSINSNEDELSLTPHSKTNSEVVKIAKTKPIRKRQKSAVIPHLNTIAEESSGTESVEKHAIKDDDHDANTASNILGRVDKKLTSKLTPQAEELASESTSKRGRKKVSKPTAPAKSISQSPKNDSKKIVQQILTSEIPDSTAGGLKNPSPNSRGRKKIKSINATTVDRVEFEDSMDSNNYETNKKTGRVEKLLERKKKPIIEDITISQISEDSISDEISPKGTNQRKKIAFNRKRQTLGVGNENSTSSNNVSVDPVQKKKRKIALGKNRQSIELNTSADIVSSPPKSSNTEHSRYSIAPNTGKRLGSILNGPGYQRLSILSNAGNRKQSILPKLPPSLPGSSRKSTLNPPRRLGSMKSSGSLESIKSGFNLSNILNKK